MDLRRWWVLLNWVLDRECVRGISRISENETERLEKQSMIQSKESEEAIIKFEPRTEFWQRYKVLERESLTFAKERPREREMEVRGFIRGEGLGERTKVLVFWVW